MRESRVLRVLFVVDVGWLRYVCEDVEEGQVLRWRALRGRLGDG